MSETAGESTFDWTAATASVSSMVQAQSDKVDALEAQVDALSARLGALVDEYETEVDVLALMTGLPDTCEECADYESWIKGKGRRIALWVLGVAAYIALIVWLATR